MNKLNVLMVGVDMKSTGGMLTVAKYYMNSKEYNDACNLYYVGTATRNNKIMKIIHFILVIPEIVWILFSKKIDIVHIHLAEKTSVSRKMIVVKLAKLFNKKIVVHLHAGIFMQWYDTLGKFYKKKVTKLFNDVDKILVLGDYWKNELSRIAEKKKISVLYNGIETYECNQYNIGAKDITFFAHLRRTKGIHELLNAFKDSLVDIPNDTVLNLCGMSDEFDIDEYIRDNNLLGRVVYHGWVDGNQKQELINRTAIYILPTYFEGLSMTILEGMAYGIPVVTTNVTTMPELLKGIVPLSNPRDTRSIKDLIIRLLKDPLLRKEISEKEFERVEQQFSVDKMIKQTLKFYEEVIIK